MFWDDHLDPWHVTGLGVVLTGQGYLDPNTLDLAIPKQQDILVLDV